MGGQPLAVIGRVEGLVVGVGDVQSLGFQGVPPSACTAAPPSRGALAGQTQGVVVVDPGGLGQQGVQDRHGVGQQVGLPLPHRDAAVLHQIGSIIVCSVRMLYSANVMGRRELK